MDKAEIEALFAMMRAAPPAQSIAELRAGLEAVIPLLNAGAPDVGNAIADVPLFPGVTADVLVPPGTPPFPALIYLHGGGWSICSPKTHDKLARRLCLGAGAVVLNVAYRLAPEHPFPTPHDDCVAAAQWAMANIAQYGGDPTRMAIGGDSAGANLSAATIVALRGRVDFRAALLLCGAFDLGAGRALVARGVAEEDPVLPLRNMELMLDAYLSGGGRTDDPRVSPLHADLSGFPPACLIAGTADPLCGESVAMADKLAALGRPCALHRYAGMPHVFFLFEGLPEGDAALAAASAFLRDALR